MELIMPTVEFIKGCDFGVFVHEEPYEGEADPDEKRTMVLKRCNEILPDLTPKQLFKINGCNMPLVRAAGARTIKNTIYLGLGNELDDSVVILAHEATHMLQPHTTTIDDLSIEVAPTLVARYVGGAMGKRGLNVATVRDTFHRDTQEIKDISSGDPYDFNHLFGQIMASYAFEIVDKPCDMDYFNDITDKNCFEKFHSIGATPKTILEANRKFVLENWGAEK
jgi:hypothetical protein